ncbi:ribonuclease H-like domain-containing protein [Tanacetum coccineum]
MTGSAQPLAHDLLVKLLRQLAVTGTTASVSPRVNNASKHVVPNVQPVAYNTYVNPPSHVIPHGSPSQMNPPGFYYPPAQSVPVVPGPIYQPSYYTSPGLIHSSPSGFPYYPAQTAVQPTYPVGTPVQPNVNFGPVPIVQAAQSIPGQQSFNSGTTGHTTQPGQATTLPYFIVGTLHDPATSAWHMDTGASSHLSNSVTSLSTVFNSCMFPSISVGDGHSIPVTNTGHSILPTPTKSLRLNNVLITLHIVKNLIYVRQFVRDNNCTIEFDALGFSVKDFLTSRVLLRCDSTGDLYPITDPSPIPHAFLVSQNTWHQRLGHPRGEVLRCLVSSNFIPYNKEKPPILCHACQLGKHVRLPFVSSSTMISSCFDIIPSDVWTSSILSLSGFKYYVLFFDHYSHFVWVYPLVNKSGVMSKFVLFRKYVRTQFKCEIKSFQCDHSGEFDNRRLHTLFAQNRIQFRFSCPQTSQQNGKSERMVRTINNLIRTLLFQANISPTFWVEALNMATHLLNILPSTAIANNIPYTRLYGKDPNYTILCIF